MFYCTSQVKYFSWFNSENSKNNKKLLITLVPPFCQKPFFTKINDKHSSCGNQNNG